MIKKKEAMSHTTRENMRGGKGQIQFVNLFEGEELPKTRVFSVLTIQPGDSIGEHPHTGEGEAYIILEGSATVSEDGVDYILNAGDAEYCSDGHTHAILNHTDKPVSLLAIVIL